MANISNLITLLIFTTYHFSYIFCQFNLEPKFKYRPRKLESRRLHLQRKASGLTDLYNSEFLKEIESRMGGLGSKVPHQWQAAVDTQPKKKRTRYEKSTEDENLPEKKNKAGRKERKKKEESVEVEDGNPEPTQPAVVEKQHLRKGHHAKNHKGKHGNKKTKQNTDTLSNCNRKCFTPKCEVECTGEQASAACSAPGCKALTRGEDSASLCSGYSCHALCFKDECISGCEGAICFVKCHGKRCHAVSEGNESGSVCLKEGCMAYGNGNGTQIKCHGDGCEAQCMGERCLAECNGTNCVAGCTGKDCSATCVGKNCQQLEHVREVSDKGEMSTSKHDAGYYGNKYYLATTIITTELPNKNKIGDPEDLGHVHSDTDDDSPENVRLEYSVDIRLTPSLGGYLRDKVLQFDKMVGFLRSLPSMRRNF